ncbi:hypothetical protein PSEUDO8BK_10763 [Pseudomonas sp. 8BK]|nr:hypothetical protein PSEUDO8BK_10763 [Pseudomonas sp. 8BK]
MKKFPTKWRCTSPSAAACMSAIFRRLSLSERLRPLSIGLEVSSITVMGSVKANKGGAAGSLEANAYELGTGLGITFFGVFVFIIFSRTILLTVDLAKPPAERSRIPE